MTRQMSAWAAGAGLAAVVWFGGSLRPATAAVTGISECGRISVGLVPLSDLRQGTYNGMRGGLYGNGVNAVPESHAARGVAAAERVVPRNTGGRPDAGGRIVMLSIGMSNTSQEFSAFQRVVRRDGRVAPALVVVNGAQGGVTATEWADPDDEAWGRLQRRLDNAGVSARQVQVAWVKLANRVRRESPDAYRQRLERDTVATLANLRRRFRHLRQVYLSSRIYAGYASSALNPEPYAYESAFVVRAVVQRQLAGAFPRRPWLAWGPYLWADGLAPRGDGLTWACSDFASDGTHPSRAGRMKVADLLFRFFEREAASRGWLFG